MGRYIVIQNSDYKENSLLCLTIEKRLSLLTKKWIVASGNDSMTAEQKLALDSYINTLSQNAIFNYAGKIYIPFLATDYQHSLINYADSSFADDFPSGFENYTTLANHGLASKGDANVQLATDSSFSATKKNLTVLQMNSVAYPSLSDGVTELTPAVIVGNATSSISCGQLQFDTFKMRYQYNNDFNNTPSPVDDTTNALTPLVRGYVFDGDNVKNILCHSIVTSPYPTDFEDTELTGLSILQNLGVFRMSPSKTPQGFIFVGKAMPSELVLVLKNATELLYTYFNK